MTAQSSIGSGNRPSKMLSTLLKPMAEAEKGCCSGGGCRAKAMTRMNREGMSAAQTGDYASAGRILGEVIEMARRAGTSMYEAKLRNNLGLVHLLAERPREAASEFCQAMTLVEGKLGRDNSLYRRIEGNLHQTDDASC